MAVDETDEFIHCLKTFGLKLFMENRMDDTYYKYSVDGRMCSADEWYIPNKYLVENRDGELFVKLTQDKYQYIVFNAKGKDLLKKEYVKAELKNG